MKYSKEFRKWQKRFYASKQWIEVRNHIREDRSFICDECNKLIKGKSIVDHIKEITPSNKDDWDITLNPENLQLLCFACHNKKHFQKYEYTYDLNDREDVNLF